MSRCRMLRSLGRCCLGKVDLLVAGGAAEVLPVPLNCPLPLLRTYPPSLLVCCFLVFAEIGATSSTASGRLKVNLFLSEKRDGKFLEALWYNPGFSCIGDLKILHSQPFAATYIHADKQCRILGSLSCLADAYAKHSYLVRSVCCSTTDMVHLQKRS
jgi:hypothetical protein